MPQLWRATWIALALFGCQSRSGTPTDSMELDLGSQSSGTGQDTRDYQANNPNAAPYADRQGPPTNVTTSITTDEKIIAQQLKGVELAFVKKDCTQIKSHKERLESLRAGSHSLPLLTRLAFAWCDAEANPLHRATNERALQLLSSAQKELSPLVNSAYLEELKAERYLKAGKTDLLLNSKKRLREYLREQENKAIVVDGEIFALSNGVTQLNGEQRARLNNVLAAWENNDNLLKNLTECDKLLAEVQNEEARTLVMQVRLAILTRIEEQFAYDAGFLEARQREGNTAQALAHAEKMKEKYPSEAYHKRIAAILQPTVLATEITEKQPSNASEIFPTEPSSSNIALDGGKTPTPDTELAKAKLLLDSGKPEEAILLIDSSALLQTFDKAQKLRREAAEIAVRQGRVQVRNLYNRAGTLSDRAQKLETLKEARKILENLLSKYPNAQGRTGIERNLRTIQLDIEGLQK